MFSYTIQLIFSNTLSWLYLFNTDAADMNLNAFSALTDVHQLHLVNDFTLQTFIKAGASDAKADKCSISNHHHHNHRQRSSYNYM